MPLQLTADYVQIQWLLANYFSLGFSKTTKEDGYPNATYFQLDKGPYFLRFLAIPHQTCLVFLWEKYKASFISYRKLTCLPTCNRLSFGFLFAISKTQLSKTKENNNKKITYPLSVSSAKKHPRQFYCTLYLFFANSYSDSRF